MNKNLKLVLEDVKNGKPIIIIDDSHREDEADLMLAAEKVSVDNIVFMINKGKGLMCLPCLEDRVSRLKIPMMPSNNLDSLQTPFTVSIDGVEGTTTGMSASDRVKTIGVFTREDSRPEELSQPGHLFPLRAKSGLLKERRGHTESSIEITKLAGLKPVAVIVEIMNNDGTMTKGEQVKEYAKKNKLRIITIDEIYEAAYGV